MGSLRGWLSDAALSPLSWVFPILIATVLLASLMLWPGEMVEPPLLAPVLNLLFVFAIPVGAAVLAGRGYVAGGSVPLLLMGCGSMAFSFAGLLAGWFYRPPSGPDLGIAIYSLSALLSGLCAFAAAGLALGGHAKEQAPPSRLRTYALACAGVFGILGALAGARAVGLLPPFFLDGRPTTLRQAVLGLSVLLFVVSALVNWFIHLRTGAAFFRWQGLALFMIGAGLGAFYLAPTVGGVGTWIGRTAQYVGFFYLLAAIGVTAAEMSARGLRAGSGIAALFRTAGLDYRTLVEVAGEAIVLLDGKGILQYANGAAERLLGGHGERVLGRPLQDMILRDDTRAEPLAFLWAEPRAGERLPELTLRRLDGGVFPAEVAVLARPGGGGRGAVLLLRDVTQRKLAEEALRHHARELRALASQLADTEQRERRRLARLLHDGLQQLMVAAKLGLGPLEARAEDARQREAIRRVVGLVDQALAASRALTLEISPPVLYENGLPMALKWLAGRFGEKYNLEIAVRADPAADPGSDSLRAQLFFAARELLLNVVKHAGVAEASLSLDQSDGWLVLRVADEGAGFTFDEARPGGGGFGLFGLRERVEALGGAVRIDTAPGQGTRIELLAPLGADDERDLDGERPVLPVDQSRRRARRRGDPRPPGCLRLLIVDDHEVVRTGLASLLNEHPDIEVVGQVADGDEALVAVARWQPDVVVMDVSMARMSGIEATRRLLDKRPALRVIGLSMHDDGFIRAAMEEAGAVACLPKGGPVEDLIATIRRRAGDDEEPPPAIA